MKLKKYHTLLKPFIALALVLLAAGCGSDGSVGSGNTDTGAITAKLDWSNDTSAITDKLNGSDDTNANIVLALPGVVTVRIIVSGTGMSDVQKDFASAVGQGTVDNIPAGSSRTVTAKGLNASGNAIAQGAISNITIIAGQTTDAGTITMQPTTPPSTPTGFAVTAASSSQINLSWEASAGATGYRIYQGGSLLKSVTTLSTSDTGLSPSTRYCYSVAAYNSAGDSAQTSQVCATTLAPIPTISEIAGTYTLSGTMTSAPCGGYSSFLNNSAILMTTNGNNVSIYSSAIMTGGYDSSNGSFNGSGTGTNFTEMITGMFNKSGSTIKLTGTLVFQDHSCIVTYGVTYSKN